MPPVLLDWQRFFCYENRTDAYGDLPALCDRRCPSGSIRKELHCNHAFFSVPESGNPGWNLVFIAPPESVIEYLRGGQRLCNLMEGRGCGR
jgi:hypothetical protein